MKKNIPILLTIIISFLVLLPAQPQIDTILIADAAQGAGYEASAGEPQTIPATVGTVIQILLSFVGTIFFIFIIVSGIQWMTAGGNEEKVTKARTRIINASVGLGITIVAYFITWFISTAILGT